MTRPDISALADDLDSDDFDPIACLNRLFPTCDSLAFLTEASQDLDAAREQVDQVINKTIQKSATFTELGRTIVEESKEALADLDGRVATLLSQAQNTENVVEDVCGSIKKFDGAKINLTKSITTLKRLEMAQMAVTELEMMAQQRKFGECADRILALSTLMEFFKGFEMTDLLKEIDTKFERLKRQVHNQLSGEFAVKLFGASVDPSVAAACRAVDAFGEQYRNETIEMFCSKFLEGYQATFQNSPLGEIDRRINWLKQRVEFFNKEYASVFPSEWRVQYFLARYFCNDMKNQIRDILTRKKPTLQEFQHGFEQTAKFERVLSESFGRDEVNEKGETVWKPATEFIGLVGGAFANHTDLYIQAERNQMKVFILRAKNKVIGKKQIIDVNNKLLKSGVELVQYMKMSIEKCGGFSVGSALYRLFFVLKDIIIEYVQTMGGIMPTKITSNFDLKLICVITNTTYYFSSIIEGLAKRIRESVNDPNEKAGVRVDDVQDQLYDAIRQQLKSFSSALCEETRPILDSIISGSWQTGNQDTNFKFHIQLCELFNKNLSFIRKWLCDENFASLRSIFVPEWVSAYFNSAFRCKQPLTSVGTERLTIATKELRDTFLAKFVSGSETTMALQKRFITEEFATIDNGLKVVLSPENAMIPIYQSLFPRGNKEQFMLLVRQRGLPNAQVEKLENSFVVQLKRTTSV